MSAGLSRALQPTRVGVGRMSSGMTTGGVFGSPLMVGSSTAGAPSMVSSNISVPPKKTASIKDGLSPRLARAQAWAQREFAEESPHMGMPTITEQPDGTIRVDWRTAVRGSGRTARMNALREANLERLRQNPKFVAHEARVKAMRSPAKRAEALVKINKQRAERNAARQASLRERWQAAMAARFPGAARYFADMAKMQLGREEIGLKRELGKGELDVKRELGQGEIDVKRELGHGELDVKREEIDARRRIADQELQVRREIAAGDQQTRERVAQIEADWRRQGLSIEAAHNRAIEETARERARADVMRAEAERMQAEATAEEKRTGPAVGAAISILSDPNATQEQKSNALKIIERATQGRGGMSQEIREGLGPQGLSGLVETSPVSTYFPGEAPIDPRDFANRIDDLLRSGLIEEDQVPEIAKELIRSGRMSLSDIERINTPAFLGFGRDRLWPYEGRALFEPGTEYERRLRRQNIYDMILGAK